MKTQIILKNLLGILIIITFSGCTERKNPNNETDLWPEIEPFETGYLKVSDIHEIYYELSGNPKGIPVFVIHGGPGAGCSPHMRQFFNPEQYLIVLHDQRGCGKSKPNAELEENNTQELVKDIERLREKLNLDKIILFGGSWGTTLSLTYAEEYPENVNAMVLRGIYLGTQEEIDMNYPRLKSYFPELYQNCMNLMPELTSELNDSLIFGLSQTLPFNEWKKYLIARDKLDLRAYMLNPDDHYSDEFYNSEENLKWLNSMYTIYFHYILNSYFLEDLQLLNNSSRVQDIPVTIVHGRYDMLCPPLYAYLLHQRLPNSELIITELSAHSMTEKPIEKELLKAMKKLENILE
jgi:proline iminopeptidase